MLIQIKGTNKQSAIVLLQDNPGIGLAELTFACRKRLSKSASFFDWQYESFPHVEEQECTDKIIQVFTGSRLNIEDAFGAVNFEMNMGHWDRKPILLSLLNPCSWE